MCGRYVTTSSRYDLAATFRVDAIDVEEHAPSYNVAPRAQVYAVVERKGERRLEERRWGLVPSWAKDLGIGDRMINARAESVLDKPAYRAAFLKRRCLLPADGFYEWKTLPAVTVGNRTRPKKQPLFFCSPQDTPLAFAGLWEAWKNPADPDAPWLTTCAIVTTAANAFMAPIHDRMPVILASDTWARWLDPATDPSSLVSLLGPAPEDALIAWEVDTRVGNARNDDPDLIVPVGPATLL